MFEFTFFVELLIITFGSNAMTIGSKLSICASIEISFSKIPSGDRAYDGTRAADHTGKGLDGKLRLFITKNNSRNFPYLTKLIKSLGPKFALLVG